MIILNDKLDNYIDQHSGIEDEILQQLYRETHLKNHAHKNAKRMDTRSVSSNARQHDWGCIFWKLEPILDIRLFVWLED